MIEIIHNPHCSKSRAALNFLKESGLDVKEIRYLENPLNKEELRNILTKLGISPYDLIRKNEVVFKDEFKDKDLSDEEWIDAMVKYPKLIERPIVINGNRAVVGRPLAKVEEII